MDGWIVGVIVAIAGQFGLLWYKFGKLEQKVKDLCREVHDSNSKKEE